MNLGEIVKMDNGKDNEIMAMMNDASLCPLLEETKVGVSNYCLLYTSEIVDGYKAITERIALKQKINDNLVA